MSDSKKPQKKQKDTLSNLKYLGGVLLKKMLRGGARVLGRNADEVNKLNVFPVPDGDTGDNMRMTIESGVNAVEQIDTDNLADVMEALSRGMLLGARGNSGVILSQFFAGIAKGLEDVESADAEALGAALELGVKRAYSSVMTPTEGTILTVARESVEYAVRCVTEKSTIRSFFDDLLREMQASLKRTPETLSVLKEAMVVDSGGAGLLYIMAGFASVLNGEDIGDEPIEPQETAAAAAAPAPTSFDADSRMPYGYCTELLIQLQHAKTDVAGFDVEALKHFLGEHGDSVVAVKSDTVVRLHVHTFAPEVILAHCRRFGEFITVKIENMSLQHSALAEEETEPAAKPTERYGVVAVTSGEGMETLFRDLGATEIIHGGQAANPSTSDFLAAFARIPAEHIFVLPNNGNIVMAATQAAELYGGAAVHVIPSKNLGMGYAALSSANFEDPDAAAVAGAMVEAMARVATGCLSHAIRDVDIGGVHIENGDTIAIVGKEIVLSKRDRIPAAESLADWFLASGERSILTVFTGEDVPAEEAAGLESYLAEHYPTVEVYVIGGGQEIYSYVFVAE